MNNANYIIRGATKNEIDHISETYWSATPQWQEKRHHYHTYVAVDKNDIMLGYLVLEDKDIPIPPYGKDRFIVTIVVFREHRRRGIGTALLAHAFHEAKTHGILHFQGSANPTKEAQGFWSRNGFVFLKFGPPHKDPSKPERFGNHTHLIFRRVENVKLVSLLGALTTDIPLKTEDADRHEVDRIFDQHIAKACTAYVAEKRHESRALLIKDSHGGTLGFLVYFDEPMAAPLSGKNRFLGYIYVNEEERGHGLAKLLLSAFLTQALKEDIAQIVDVHPEESVVPFFIDLGFDVFITRYIMRPMANGKYAVGIGQRLETGSLVLP